MQTSTSLTFFTAIFVALGSTLAEELMICCRHVRTELYIYIYFLIIFNFAKPLSDEIEVILLSEEIELNLTWCGNRSYST